jgi:hypothetical protein
MRRTVAFLALTLAAAASALAQSNQGAFGIDAMVAPTTSFGFAYYLTDGLSLRPWVGLGYSDYNGFYANASAQLRYEFRARARVAPYLSATAQYSHYGNSGYSTVGQVTGGTGYPTGGGSYQTVAMPADLGQFGAGAGLRYRISDSFALFGEGRVLYTTSPLGTSYGWSSAAINDQTHFDAVLGLTYLLR